MMNRNSRPPRLYVVSFNGTWAGGVLTSRKTVVSEFVKLIADHENAVEIPVNGVGSDIGIVDRVLGGIGGWGTLRNVITALRNICKQYRRGDRIILLGYSRGAWAARYLAMLIDIVGGSLFDSRQRAVLLEKYECWKDIQIDALCCFDTVGSLGLPLTGVAKPLQFLRGSKNSDNAVSDVAPNVKIAFHCISLHEFRAAYQPTFLGGNNVHQVFFPGNHSHMGWIDEKEGLVHAPFAWMIQQLHTHLGLSFDEAKMALRFPSYCPSTLAPTPTVRNADCKFTETQIPPSLIGDHELPRWCRGHISSHNLALLFIIGKKRRPPGWVSGLGRIKVHIGARLRTPLSGTDTVPGYTLMAPIDGKPYWTCRQRSNRNWNWARRQTNPSLYSGGSDSSISSYIRGENFNGGFTITASRLQEAEVGSLEAKLLGLPQNAVTS
ncbi:hypothetical protein ONZ43_g4373 [Nemania bipapillata]|uniref:Uncharacterized protein n=1 Tax=Nemania bipapillata TaxID=110536 RepID=A0ACC2INP7_9PEZI|nr:hypothetical protein ONZ43_g4373 [Nemania bipapillata]